MPFHGTMKYFSRTKWAWVFIVIVSHVKVKWYCLNQSYNCLRMWNHRSLLNTRCYFLIHFSFYSSFHTEKRVTRVSCVYQKLCIKDQLVVVLCHFSETSSCTVLTDLLLECNTSQMNGGWNGAKSEMSRGSMFETHFRRTINVMSVIYYLDIFHFTAFFSCFLGEQSVLFIFWAVDMKA